MLHVSLAMHRFSSLWVPHTGHDNCFNIPGEFPSASEKVAVMRREGRAAPTGEPPISDVSRLRAPRLSWVALTNADRRFCSRAKTAGDLKTAS